MKPGGISSTWCETSTVAGESGSQGEHATGGDQVLAAPEVEPGGRLVEEQQLGVGHQRAGDLHPLALPLAEGAERAVDQVRRADLAQQARGPLVVELVVVLAPATEHAVRRGHDDVAHQLVARDAVGERGAGQADARAAGRRRRRCRAPRRGCRRRPRWGGSGPRRPAAAWSCRRRWGRGHPALVLLDRPVDVVQQRRPTTAHRDVGELEHGGSCGSPYQRTRAPATAGVSSPAVTSLDLPRPARLAWWLTAWLRGDVVTDHAARRGRSATTPTHLVVGLPGTAGRRSLVGARPAARRAGADRGRRWRSRSRATRSGSAARAAFNAAALEAGEAVVVAGAELGLVPARVGRRSSWQCLPRRRAPAARRRRGRPRAARRPASTPPRARRRSTSPAGGPRSPTADEPAPPPGLAPPARGPAALRGPRRARLQAAGDRRPRARGRRRRAVRVRGRTGGARAARRSSGRPDAPLVAACSPEVWPHGLSVACGASLGARHDDARRSPDPAGHAHRQGPAGRDVRGLRHPGRAGVEVLDIEQIVLRGRLVLGRARHRAARLEGAARRRRGGRRATWA